MNPHLIQVGDLVLTYWGEAFVVAEVTHGESAGGVPLARFHAQHINNPNVTWGDVATPSWPAQRHWRKPS